MYERAMEKIRDEIAGSKKKEVTAAGEFLTILLRRYPGIAEAILTDGKTVKGYYDAMEAKARKEKLTMIEGAGFAAEYFGFDPALLNGDQEPPKPEPPKPEPDALDLDALLGGML